MSRKKYQKLISKINSKMGHPNKTLKQFLENDRKVLNFDISWFDDKYDKEEKVYKMNYYLADGKVSKNIYNIIYIIFLFNIDRNSRNKSKQ